jgi:hypothetical protein
MLTVNKICEQSLLVERLLTPQELANLLRVDCRTLLSLQIPSIRVGRQRRYSAQVIRSFLENA